MKNLVIPLLAMAVLASASDKGPNPTVPVAMVVTVEGRHGQAAAELNPEDILVYQGRDRLQVTGWQALRDNLAGVELYILLDDSARSSVALQFEDMRRFMRAQPATTAIAIGYMRNGIASISQPLTRDHEHAAKALRLPMGSLGAFGSPYCSVSDLIQRWRASCQRHVVLMITEGVDRFGGFGLSNPYVDMAIEDAQRAGVAVYAIYTPGLGHAGHGRWGLNWGQNFLAQVAEETGGEAYFLGLGAPVSFAPYLDQMAERLTHQYRLTFLMPSDRTGFQAVRLMTEVPRTKLLSAPRVYVPGEW